MSFPWGILSDRLDWIYLLVSLVLADTYFQNRSETRAQIVISQSHHWRLLDYFDHCSTGYSAHSTIVGRPYLLDPRRRPARDGSRDTLHHRRRSD